MNGEGGDIRILQAVAIAAAAAIASAALILALRRVLKRYGMAHPNARSSHKIPTPQGGGIALIAATLLVTYGALYLLPAGLLVNPRLPLLAAAAVLIACVGALADIHVDNVVPRLLAQTLAVAVAIYALPPETRVIPVLPEWSERLLLIVGGLWFVNLVNFMDGLDWMTVAEVVPVTAALAVSGLLGILSSQETILSLSLCGAMIGFAYFNRPVAKLFLGDVGSLPIGLLLGWLLVLLAGNGGRAAALLLPLYYLADSTLTLLGRLMKGERVWQAHRSHFYQRATDGGFTVIAVVARVFAINLGLAALAIAIVILPGKFNDLAALAAGAALVAWLLTEFARGKR
jgi:UDP-N-acetylmuramyl pentapeptide phosphotransferase/UDP-N-acetylglucosamine-1-phosphate transferase